MNRFEGLPIQTVSTVTAAQVVKVDHAAVRVYRTLYGEIHYVVEAAKLGGAEWYPVSREYDRAEDALERCREIEQEIEKARAAEAQRRAEIENRFGGCCYGNEN